MGVLIDETGNKYGWLTVISRGSSTKGGDARWKCIRRCGNETEVIGALLRRGVTKSCGCYRSESIAIATNAWRLPKGEAAFNWVYDDFRRRAERRGNQWNLTKEQVKDIISKPCHYCGISYSNHAGKHSDFNGSIKYNGLDRVDNIRGYSMDNVVPCCKTCNVAKNNLSLVEFREWAERLCSHWLNGKQ
jgi:hypothetical protein